jgi:hypothetical protein
LRRTAAFSREPFRIALGLSVGWVWEKLEICEAPRGTVAVQQLATASARVV